MPRWSLDTSSRLKRHRCVVDLSRVAEPRFDGCAVVDCDIGTVNRRRIKEEGSRKRRSAPYRCVVVLAGGVSGDASDRVARTATHEYQRQPRQREPPRRHATHLSTTFPGSESAHKRPTARSRSAHTLLGSPSASQGAGNLELTAGEAPLMAATPCPPGPVTGTSPLTSWRA